MDHGRGNSAFALSLRRIQLFGWWKTNSKSFTDQFAYGVFRALALFWLFLYTTLQLIDLYEAVSSLEKLSTNLCGTSASVVAVIKTFTVLYKAKAVEALHLKLINNLYLANTGKEEEEEEIFVRSRAEILRLTKIFFGLVVPTMFVWSVMPLIDESEDMRLPLRLWSPFDWHSSPNYEIFYAYQVTGLWVFAVNILSQDLIIFGFIIQLCSQYEVLEKNIRNLNRFCGDDAESNMIATKNERELLDSIKESVCHHQEILRTIKQLQSIYNECFSAHFSGAFPLVCVIGFSIISESKTKGVTTLMITQVGYVGSALFDVFFFCYFGERLKQKGLRIAEAVYDSLWYKMGQAPRKLLHIIMARAQSSPGLSAGNIMSLNLRSFLQILRNSYNIIAVMNQMS